MTFNMLPYPTLTGSTRARRTLTQLLLVVSATWLVGACGGGGGGVSSAGVGSSEGAGTPPPVPSVPVAPPPAPTIYATDAVFKQLVSNGYSATLTVGGTVVSLPASGTAAMDAYAGTPSTFEGAVAIEQLVSESRNVNVNGKQDVTGSSLHRFYNASFEPLGEVDSNTGAYSSITSFSGWPKSVKVGDSGPLSTSVKYSSVLKARIVGRQSIDYSVEADSVAAAANMSNAASALLVLTNKDLDASGKLIHTRQTRFRIGTDGSLVLISVRDVEAGATALADLVLSATSVASAKPLPTQTGPIIPVPSDLWQAPAAVVPSTGNYVYLQSDAGDYIGGGGTYLYSTATSKLAANMTDGAISVNVTGDQWWHGSFAPMAGVTRIMPGYYGGAVRSPFNGTAAGVDWGGEGRGCNTSKSWYVIDEVGYANGVVSSFALRFEQHCEGTSSALRGQIRWAADDTTRASGPALPIPTDLWAPLPSALPVSGNYVYLQSDAGDYIGGGRTFTLSAPGSAPTVQLNGNLLSVVVNGNQFWSGEFMAMDSQSELVPGYYGSLSRYPFHNPARGGLNWSGDGRGCNSLGGWFAIDSIRIVNGTLMAVDLRFEQHCENGAAALHGKLHWIKP